MKKIIKSIFAVTLSVFLFTSCEDEQDLKFVSNAADFKILSPQTNDGVVLSPLTPSNPGLSMTWEDMNYLTPTAVTYRVEIDKAGDNFDTPINLTETSNTFVTITSNELNTQAVAAGLTAFMPGTLEIRIRATIGSPQSAEKFSNVITYNVTTFSTALPRIYVVGNFLMDSGYGSNWTPANAVPLIASAPSETDYEGYVYFNTANFEYKFLHTEQWLTAGIYELCYGFDFISVELFFRGFLVVALSRFVGKDAILVMVVVYAFLHFGKPAGETISSIFGGYILGILAYSSRNIYGGLVAHLGVAWGMEYFAYLQS